MGSIAPATRSTTGRCSRRSPNDFDELNEKILLVRFRDGVKDFTANITQPTAEKEEVELAVVDFVNASRFMSMFK